MRLLFLALLFSLPIAHADKRQARVDARQLRTATAELSEIGELYWRAVRWGKVDEAAPFLADPDERIDWLAQGASELGFRYQSAKVLHVEMGPALEEHPQGYLRQATLLVEVQGYAGDQVLERQVRSQSWFLTDAGWFVASGERVGVPR